MFQPHIILGSLLTFLTVLGHYEAHRFFGGQGPGDFWLGYSDDDWTARWPIDSHLCRCSAGIFLPNVCFNRTGVTKLGCPVSNRYVQCTGASCSIQTCPTAQVWNFTINSCAPCAAGMHVDTRGRQRCACNRGTRIDRQTRQCVPCPSGAVVEEDRCYCPGNLAFNRKSNNCSICPSDTTLPQLFGGCYCLDRKLFWSADEWQCKSCPGSWVSGCLSWRDFLGRIFGMSQETCTCLGENQIFERQTVTCLTCPNTAVAFDGKCRCKMGGEVFDSITKTCVCGKGLTRGASGACVVNEREAAPSGPTVINP